jgi:hypothetical protein
MTGKVQTIENGAGAGNPELEGRTAIVDGNIGHLAASILGAFGPQEAEAFLEAEDRASLGLESPVAQPAARTYLPPDVIQRPISDGNMYGLAG